MCGSGRGGQPWQAGGPEALMTWGRSKRAPPFTAKVNLKERKIHP